MVLELQKSVSFPFREHLEREDKEAAQLDVPVRDPVRMLKRQSPRRVKHEFLLVFSSGSARFTSVTVTDLRVLTG